MNPSTADYRRWLLDDAARLRAGRAPVEGEWPWAPDDDSVFAWYDERLAELVHELDGRDTSVLDQSASSIGANGTVLVAAGGSRLLVTMSDAGQSLARVGAETAADAYVEGTAPDLYRWLWNRPPEGCIMQDGNSAVLQRLQARLAVGMD